MSQAAKTLFVFGIYLCGLGLLLLLVPNLLLRVFRAPPTHEVWIRLNGMFVLCLSFFYVKAARNQLTIFHPLDGLGANRRHLFLYRFRAVGLSSESATVVWSD